MTDAPPPTTPTSAQVVAHMTVQPVPAMMVNGSGNSTAPIGGNSGLPPNTIVTQPVRKIAVVSSARTKADHADTAAPPAHKQALSEVALSQKRLEVRLMAALDQWARAEKQHPPNRALTLHAPMAASVRFHVQYRLPTPAAKQEEGKRPDKGSKGGGGEKEK